MAWTKERSRCWNVLLYPDDTAHFIALSKIRSEYQYVGICHDRDVDDNGELKKPHYHIILKFRQARWNTSVAEELGIPVNYMERTKSFDNSARYLLHEGVDNKFQYEQSDLEGPLVGSVCKAMCNDDEDIRVLNLLELIRRCKDPITVTQLVTIACENGLYGELRRMGSLALAVMNEHNSQFCDYEQHYSELAFLRKE